ncbi:MAG: HAMP domain-containing protein [Bryobacterales bacterium]|nr:HAMP domain-containing protein [Bryobacterales bacterium]
MTFAALAARAGFLRGLRFRITVTNAVFLIGLLVAMGFFFRGVLSLILDAQIRDVLNEEWYAAKSYLVIHRNKPVWRYDHMDQEETFIVERMRHVFLLTDKDGRVIDYSVIYEDLGLNPAADIQKAMQSKDPFWEVRISSEGEPYQIRGGVFVDDDNERFFVAIGRSLAGNERTLAAFTRDYYMLLPWLILAGSLLGWFVAGSTLRPVKEFSKTAEAITGQNLSLRLPLRGSGDELDVLTVTFNRMMERLERSFEMTRRFSTDVSHELRTPLTAVRGQLEVALFTAKSQEQYREAIITALEDVERLGQTIRAMLLLSQAESGQLALQRAPLDLCAVVNDLVEQFQIPAEEAELRLSCELGEATALIEADRIQIERLVSNLLSNALKYTHKGGRVDARVRADHGDVVLEVADTGMGIPPEYLPHIFDRFYRVPGSSKEKQGLGLGLSFVAWIVQAHNGTITVDSKLGEGTTFVVRLPGYAGVEPAVNEVVGAA